MNTPTIEVRRAVKRFGEQTALDNVTLPLQAGEIHALAGLNGSGKSTLVKVLAGVNPLDAGEVFVDGQTASPLSPQKSNDLGMQFLHQDPVSFPNLTVADNIALGTHYAHSSPALVRVQKEGDWAATILAKLGVESINPRLMLRELSQAQRTMVAIARAVQDIWTRKGVRLLVLDEPTASLPEHEVTLVTDMIRRVAQEGVSVLFITHDLEMMLELADRVSVLRDGRLAATHQSSQLTQDRLASLMVGDEKQSVAQASRKKAPEDDEFALQANSVSGGRVSEASFDLRRGEILGIAGLLGSGRSTLLRLIYGAQNREGELKVEGSPIPARSPRGARQAGIALVPEDRRAHGSFTNMPMSDNVTIASLGDFSSPLWISRSKERESALATMREFDVRPGDPDKLFRLFSGGNQQKSIIGRWARTSPKVLLLDEPTQGVDVHARLQIHTAVKHLADHGLSVIVVSSDFGELLELSDRVLVMRRGHIRSEIDPSTFREDQLLHIAATETSADS